MAFQRPLIRSTTHRALPVDNRLASEPVGARLLDAGLLDPQQVRTVLNLQSVVYEHLVPALAFASEGLRGRVLGFLGDKARELLLDER